MLVRRVELEAKRFYLKPKSVDRATKSCLLATQDTNRETISCASSWVSIDGERGKGKRSIDDSNEMLIRIYY